MHRRPIVKGRASMATVRSKRIHPNRRIERFAVNVARLFFESNGVPFLEVDLRVDFGKDAVIELVDSDEPTGQLIGLQIKGGKQTRRTRKDRTIRGLPFTGKDARHFRSSNVPVLGMVPLANENFTDLLWVNLSKYCSDRFDELGEDRGGFAETIELLNAYRLKSFMDQMRTLAAVRLDSAALDLVAGDAQSQQAGVVDCFVLARNDPRALILVRKLMMGFTRPAMETAILALAHTAGHPDIFYTPRNTLPENIRNAVRQHFRWSKQELATLLSFIPEEHEDEMWGRGTFGQNIVALIAAQPSSLLNLILVGESRKDFSVTVRRRAYILAVYLSGDAAPEISSRILRYSFDLVENEQICEIVRLVQNEGWVDIY